MHAAAPSAPTGTQVSERILLLGIWLFIGLFAVAQTYIGYLSERWVAPPPSVVILWQLPPWLFWAFATRTILDLGRRFPLNDARWPRSLPVHLAAVVALVAVNSLLFIVCSYGTLVVPLWMEPLDLYVRQLNSRLLAGVMVYSAILGVGYARDYARELRAREVQSARLQEQLTQARLDALRMQLHPHFLFNALNTTAILVRETGSRDALRIVLALSDMLRATLTDSREEVPLDEEIGLLKRYLEIESIRFEDRLRVHWHIPDDLARAAVPRLILQPLVENAIRHGIARRTDARRLEISARRSDRSLIIEIFNEGPPLGGSTGEGVGLRNTRARLQELYGPAQQFLLTSKDDGVRATLEIPHRNVD